MKNNIKNLLTALFTSFCFVVSAQNIQPSMMVLPYTEALKEGAPTALERYEAEDEYKAVIAGIEQAIIDRGGELQDLQRPRLLVLRAGRAARVLHASAHRRDTTGDHSTFI